MILAALMPKPQSRLQKLVPTKLSLWMEKRYHMMDDNSDADKNESIPTLQARSTCTARRLENHHIKSPPSDAQLLFGVTPHTLTLQHVACNDSSIVCDSCIPGEQTTPDWLGTIRYSLVWTRRNSGCVTKKKWTRGVHSHASLQEAVLDWITYFLFFSYLCLDLLVDTLHWHEIAIALKRLDRCIVAKAPLNVGFAYLTVAGWIDGKMVWRH